METQEKPKTEEEEPDTAVRWWLIDPTGHRKYERENREDTMEFLGQQVPVIHSDPPLYLWVCDFCNEDIPIFYPRGEGVEEGQMVEALMVPMYDSNALCPQCVLKYLPDDANDAVRADWEQWGSGYTRLRAVLGWSSTGCGCPPCKTAADELQMTENPGFAPD